MNTTEGIHKQMAERMKNIRIQMGKIEKENKNECTMCCVYVFELWIRKEKRSREKQKQKNK